MAKPKQTLGYRIRSRRGAAVLTQGQLADAADISQATVSRIEKDKRAPSDEELASIAKALKTTVADLRGEV